jgi:hypothetical protein
MSYFTNSFPLANNKNIDFTGSAFTNPYRLIQRAGKRKKSVRRKHRKKNKTHKRKN